MAVYLFRQNFLHGIGFRPDFFVLVVFLRRDPTNVSEIVYGNLIYRVMSDIGHTIKFDKPLAYRAYDITRHVEKPTGVEMGCYSVLNASFQSCGIS